MHHVAYNSLTMDHTMREPLLILHILFGSGAFISMMLAWMSKKGTRLHRISGKIFVYTLGISLLAALIISVLTQNIMLLAIAVFTGYQLYSGKRLSTNKASKSTLDQICYWLLAIATTLMTLKGSFDILAGDYIGLVLLVFALICLSMLIEDRPSKNWPTGSSRIAKHLQRMGGASIATCTAVLVINVDTNPAFIGWLAPTIFFTPIMVYYSMQLLSSKPKLSG